ncbi:MAG: lipid droplet-associated protein [Geodermatophilaceae bacterium]|nr:lipid droplet-associated protein [Geodermatophilaceae bacterium]
MIPELPPSVRAAAGLAARSVDEARRLPRRLLSLPVVMAGAAMQASLRVQQEYAGLVARGDELLVRLGGGEDEPPPWAEFDEPPAEAVLDEPAADPLLDEPPVAPLLDEPPVDAGLDDPLPVAPGSPKPVRRRTPRADLGRVGRGGGRAAVTPFLTLAGDESAFDRVVRDETAAAASSAPAGHTAAPDGTTEPMVGYDGWSVAQLRARLRRMSVTQLAQLLAYEEATRARAPYLTMLQNRLVTAGTT